MVTKGFSEVQFDREGTRKKLSKHNMSSIWGLRVSLGIGCFPYLSTWRMVDSQSDVHSLSTYPVRG